MLLLLVSVSMKAKTAENNPFIEDSVKHITVQDYDSLQKALDQTNMRLSEMEREQELEKIWKRKKYWKIGYAIPAVERTDGESMTWNTEFSVYLQRGKTAYFHSKPIGGMVKIGLDYGFMDISYTKLKLKDMETSLSPDINPGFNPGRFGDDVEEDPDEITPDINFGLHKFEYGLHVGPSIHVNPWKHLIVSTYFHVKPTLSGVLENENLSWGLGCTMSAGVSVAYKAISIGVEGLWGKVKYKQLSMDDEELEDMEEEETPSIFNTKKFRLKQKCPCFYIKFRF